MEHILFFDHPQNTERSMAEPMSASRIDLSTSGTAAGILDQPPLGAQGLPPPPTPTGFTPIHMDFDAGQLTNQLGAATHYDAADGACAIPRG